LRAARIMSEGNRRVQLRIQHISGIIIMPPTSLISRLAALSILTLGPVLPKAQIQAQSPKGREVNRDLVKVTAVQISGYDKGDLPKKEYDPTEALLPYIDQAGKGGSQLVVFPEYVLGRIRVPGPETEKLAEVAKANGIYVIVGCWELYADDTFANTALVFDRSGRIAGKYHKTHAAVDHYEGDPPWSKPPSGKSRARTKTMGIHFFIATSFSSIAIDR